MWTKIAAPIYQIIKIHPGSTLIGKKVPAIVYDELVRSLLRPLQLECLLNTSQDLHQSSLCAWCIVCAQNVLRWDSFAQQERRIVTSATQWHSTWNHRYRPPSHDRHEDESVYIEIRDLANATYLRIPCHCAALFVLEKSLCGTRSWTWPESEKAAWCQWHVDFISPDNYAVLGRQDTASAGTNKRKQTRSTKGD